MSGTTSPSETIHEADISFEERYLWHAIQLLSGKIQKYSEAEQTFKLKQALRDLNKLIAYYHLKYPERINVPLEDRANNIMGLDYAKSHLNDIVKLAREASANAERKASVNAERKGIEEAALTRKLEGWNEIIRTAEANLSRIPPKSPSRAPLTRKLERAQAIVASIEAAKRHLSTTLTDGSPQLIRAARETLEKAYIAANSARATINGESNFNIGENTEYEVESHENYPQLTPASNYVVPSASSVYSGQEPPLPHNPGNLANSPIVIEEEEGGRRRNVKRRRTVRRNRKGRRFNRTRK